MNDRVRIERADHVLIITMVREDKRNAVDRAMADALDEAFNLLDDDGGLWAGVLQARGRVFCAGSDLTSGGDYHTERGGEYGLVRRRRSTPLIAAVEGPALGGGMEIALACDLVVAGRDASFGLPEVGIGLIPTCGGLFRGPRALPVNVARQLILTGDPMTAAEAHRVGFVNTLTEPGAASATALALAQRICRNSPTSVRACMAALDTILSDNADEDGWAATTAATDAIRDTADAREGVTSFLEKRPPVWTGR